MMQSNISKQIQFNQIFKSVFSLELSNRTKNEIEYTLEEYQRFISLLEQLSLRNSQILQRTLKEDEIFYNHSMESTPQESEMLIESMVDPHVRKDSIKYITTKKLTNGIITIPNIKHLHSILMKGISLDEEGNKKFRLKEVFVGYFENGEKVVQYIPPQSADILFSMQEVLALINDPEVFGDASNIFVQPAIVHALIAIIQPFDEGNTRTSRLINYALLLSHTNQLYQKSFKLPIVYLSRSYSGFREQYRDLIAKIAQDPSNENWNQWIYFNLFMIQNYFEYVKKVIYDNHLLDTKVK